jgi:2-methylcitrate dehydratase PrpD
MADSSVEDVPVTRILATFAATSTPTQLTPDLITKVKEVLIDYCGVVIGALPASSTKPIYTAISTLQGPLSSGPSTVVGHGPPHMLPQYAALINSALGHSLDFDDTYAPGSLHAGITSVSAAMTCAEHLGSSETSVEHFMLAVCVGYEVTCRLGRELGMESYRRGFHNTSTAGIFGAVAAISVLKGLSTETIEMAFGLAGSKAAGSMQYLDNGSWNKRLHPGFAVHDAFICVALAEAGVVGATRSLEGKMGFLQGYSPRAGKDLKRLVDGLGNHWTWLESSLKPFPACRMTHGFIEIADEMRKRRKREVKEKDVKKILVTMPPVNLLLIGDPTPNKIHPENQIDAQFSVYFQVAMALLYGSGMGVRVYDMLEDPSIVALCKKIAVKTDPALQVFAAALGVEWADGTVEEARQDFPLGEVQHPFTRAKVDEKFMALVAPVFGERKGKDILAMIDELENHTIEELFYLLR